MATLDGYSRRFLSCRDMRHAWDLVGYYKGSLGDIHRWLICLRCKTERFDRWHHGVSRNYDYPEGYLLPGKEKVTPAQVREAVLAEADVYVSLEDLKSSRRQKVRRVRKAS